MVNAIGAGTLRRNDVESSTTVIALAVAREVGGQRYIAMSAGMVALDFPLLRYFDSLLLQAAAPTPSARRRLRVARSSQGHKRNSSPNRGAVSFRLMSSVRCSCRDGGPVVVGRGKRRVGWLPATRMPSALRDGVS